MPRDDGVLGAMNTAHGDRIGDGDAIGQAAIDQCPPGAIHPVGHQHHAAGNGMGGNSILDVGGRDRACSRRYGSRHRRC